MSTHYRCQKRAEFDEQMQRKMEEAERMKKEMDEERDVCCFSV